MNFRKHWKVVQNVSMAKYTVPECLTIGRTLLIMKDAKKGKVASNYRSVTCLPVMWKLLTGIFAEKIYNHLLQNTLLPNEQKCGRK